MGRAFVGAVAGAIAMFVIGFIFFATPLAGIAMKNLDDAQAAAVQNVLAANIPETGTYVVPDVATPQKTAMYGKGPVATIRYNYHGFPAMDPSSLGLGFAHMLIVALLMAIGLYRLSASVPAFADQVALLGIAVVSIVIFERLGDPIWYHSDWTNALYLFVADVISLGAAGFIILKLLPKRAATPTALASDP